MIINHRQRWTFLDVPRTGSTSLCAFLASPGVGGFALGARHIYDIPAGCEDYFTFATVRHPYPRSVSLWLHFVRDRRERIDPTASATGNWPFARFVEEVLIDRRVGPDFYQKTCHEWLDAVGRIDTLLKTEDLDGGFSRLGLVPGPVTLPRLAGIARDPWQAYFNPELRAQVRFWAVEDFERFDYS